MIVIIEEAASDKLLNASAKIETELESNPTDNLIKKSNELVIIPIIPARLVRDHKSPPMFILINLYK